MKGTRVRRWTISLAFAGGLVAAVALTSAGTASGQFVSPQCIAGSSYAPYPGFTPLPCSYPNTVNGFASPYSMFPGYGFPSYGWGGFTGLPYSGYGGYSAPYPGYRGVYGETYGLGYGSGLGYGTVPYAAPSVTSGPQQQEQQQQAAVPAASGSSGVVVMQQQQQQQQSGGGGGWWGSGSGQQEQQQEQQIS